MSATKSAAFSCSTDEYRQIKEVATDNDKSVSAYIRDIVWPHVEKYYEELQNAENLYAEIRRTYRAGGVTIDDLCLLYNRPADKIRAILNKKK